MSSSLIKRYTYGNYEWPSILKTEFVCTGPMREREMIHMAQKQIEAQYETSRAIAESQFEAAEMISAEITQQTAVIERGFRSMTNALGEFSSDISSHIDELGDRLCSELSEIEWQLAQQEESLKEILAILKKSRSNEAQQLVHQGLRHYINDELTEAEERFHRALDYDTTDYQVLMNLAFIEMHKENVNDAHRFLDKALKLPDKLDPESRFRTLWAIARLYYTQKNYEMAYKYATEALNNDNTIRSKELFISGTYAALSGKTPDALKAIETSIYQDCSLFSLAVVHPDLHHVYEEAMCLLSKMSSSALDKSTTQLNSLEERFAEASKDAIVPELLVLKQNIRKYLDESCTILKKPSYSDCLKVSLNLDILGNEIDNLVKLVKLYSEKQKIESELRRKVQEITIYEEEIPKVPKTSEPGCISAVLGFLVFYLLGWLSPVVFLFLGLLIGFSLWYITPVPLKLADHHVVC